MITQHINRKASLVKQKAKRNNIVASVCIASSLTLFIPAFMTKGSLVDYVSICFRPSEVHDPYIYKEKISKSFMRDSRGNYLLDRSGKKKINIKKSKTVIGKRFCNERNTKKGIAHIVAEEMETSLEFKSKVKIRGRLKAKNPHAGLFGISAGLMMGLASTIFWSATRELEDNQDSLLHTKRSQMLKDALRIEHDLTRDQHSTQVETEYIKKGIEEELKYQYIGDDPPYPQEMIDKQKELDSKNDLLRDTSIELELASMKAELAEKQKKELEHMKEIEKLTKTVKDKVGGNNTSDHTDDDKLDQKNELINKLKEHEGGWLYTLVVSRKPLFIIGSQGSWKSFFTSTLVLARIQLENHKLVSITDPHFNKNKKLAWKELIKHEPLVYGDLLGVDEDSPSKWIEVNDGLIESMRRWEIENESTPLKTSIFDEVTNYSKHEECKESAKKFMSTVLSDPRKANEAPIIITHSLTNQGTGNSEGFKEAREEGSISLKLYSDNFQQPTYLGSLVGYKDDKGKLVDEMSVTIPKEWFNPKSIKEMFK